MLKAADIHCIRAHLLAARCLRILIRTRADVNPMNSSELTAITGALHVIESHKVLMNWKKRICAQCADE